ncbi:MAG: CRISPR-associated protein Cas4 [Oscillospiraceae bacterium]|jgi:CRISPR-associated exonuclease Cas4|nr:CRISPR-associated protein Cas4 [Oscillospiraceae bacterium]
MIPLPEEEYRQLSELQHFAFCRRQWALIHVEQQWGENLRTIEGEILHERAHDEQKTEHRGDLLIVHGLRVVSHQLQATGVCDIVEFRRSPDGVSLYGQEGLWKPRPVEYKRGRPKTHDADELQLCGQAVCLEEMLCCEITEGDLFYGEPHRRTAVSFTPQLRARVADLLREMNSLFQKGYTPKATPGKFCSACSLKDVCLPQLKRAPTVTDYLASHAREEKS